MSHMNRSFTQLVRSFGKESRNRLHLKSHIVGEKQYVTKVVHCKMNMLYLLNKIVATDYKQYY